MKIKIVQFFINNKQKYLELAKISELINKKYCLIHGYDYECQYKTWLDAKKEGFEYDENNSGNLAVYKIFFNKKLLEQKLDYDFYVFLDCDAAVSNPNIKIEDLIDNTHLFFVSNGNERFGVMLIMQTIVDALNLKLKTIDFNTVPIYEVFNFPKHIHDMFNTIGDNTFFNEGFYIIKNTETMKNFFQDCYWYAKYRINTIRPFPCGADGRSMNHMLLSKKYYPLYTVMYPQAQGCRASSYEFAYDVDKTFILHNYGNAMTVDQKIEDMKQLKNNKWWKNIR